MGPRKADGAYGSALHHEAKESYIFPSISRPISKLTTGLSRVL
jgi:hypothetical protein